MFNKLYWFFINNIEKLNQMAFDGPFFGTKYCTQAREKQRNVFKGVT